MDPLKFMSQPTAETLLALFEKQRMELANQLETFRPTLQKDEFEAVKFLVDNLRERIRVEGIMPLFDRYPDMKPADSK